MCGFVGYFGTVRDGRTLLERMTAAIAHRGPDEQGVFTAPEVGLGHARLSIVGLGDGQQPMSDATARQTVIKASEFLARNGLLTKPVDDKFFAA